MAVSIPLFGHTERQVHRQQHLGPPGGLEPADATAAGRLTSFSGAASTDSFAIVSTVGVMDYVVRTINSS